MGNSKFRQKVEKGSKEIYMVEQGSVVPLVTLVTRECHTSSFCDLQ